MANFCRTCSEKLNLPEPDIQAEPGQIVYDLCEGCGPGWFNDQGLRVPDEVENTPRTNQ
jgi:hypothetical protein